MESIKLYDGVEITVDNETETIESIAEMWEFLHITEEVFRDKAALDEVRRSIMANLIGRGYMDLSPAYAGHTVTVKLIPAK